MQHIGTISPISILAGLNGGRIFDQVQEAMKEKFCLLVSKKGVTLSMLLNAGKLIKGGRKINQQNLCANCTMRAYCIAQSN